MCLLNFRDRDELLRAAREADDLIYKNNRILLFPNFSIEAQKLHRSFAVVKAGLCSKGIKYSVLFPAKLRVIGETIRVFFFFYTSQREAVDWLETIPTLRLLKVLLLYHF